jgi:hypothetical protein
MYKRMGFVFKKIKDILLKVKKERPLKPFFIKKYGQYFTTVYREKTHEKKHQKPITKPLITNNTCTSQRL